MNLEFFSSRKYYLLLLVIFAYLFLLLFQKDKALTQDLGRHIKTGEIIVACACVPKTNLFSWLEEGHAFINHHWLSELIFYSLYRLAGVNLIVLFKIIVIFLTFCLLIFSAFKYGAKPFWIFFFSPLFLNIFAERFDARPEIFSFLLFTLFIFIINQYRLAKLSAKALFILPLIELFWVNLHIYFILGPFLVVLLLAENIYENRQKFTRKILLIFFLTVSATFLNPNLAKGALLPFVILRNYGYQIAENQNIFFLNSVIFDPKILLFEILALFLLLPILFNFKKIKVFDFLGSLFFSLAAFWQIRNFPLFVLFVLPVICRFYSLWESKIASEIKNFINSAKIVAFFLIFLFLLLNTKAQISSPFFGFGYLNSFENAANFMLINKIKGPIFNNFDVGSYLIFKFYPQAKVFVDGRPEAYSVQFFMDYRKMQTDLNFFDKQADLYKINAIFYANTDITPWGRLFIKKIAYDSAWVPIYYDGWASIFLRNNSQNKDLIAKFK